MSSTLTLSQEMRAQAEEAVTNYNIHRARIAAEVRNNMMLYLGGAAGVGAISLVVMLQVYPWRYPPPGEYLFFVVGVWMAIRYLPGFARAPAREFQQRIRNRLFPVAFGFLQHLEYRHGAEPGFLGLVPDEALGLYNREEYGDHMTAMYGGMAFELSEMKLAYKAGKGSPAPTFSGVIVNFKLPAAFPGKLIATKPDGAILRFFQELVPIKRLDRAQCGDPELDALYDFRTDNLEAAAPLLSGNVARALDLLRESLPGEPARIAVNGDQGFLLVPHKKDFFELPDISAELVYEKHVEAIAAELLMLLECARLVRSAFEPAENATEDAQSSR